MHLLPSPLPCIISISFWPWSLFFARPNAIDTQFVSNNERPASKSTVQAANVTPQGLIADSICYRSWQSIIPSRGFFELPPVCLRSSLSLSRHRATHTTRQPTIFACLQKLHVRSTRQLHLKHAQHLRPPERTKLGTTSAILTFCRVELRRVRMYLSSSNLLQATAVTKSNQTVPEPDHSASGIC